MRRGRTQPTTRRNGSESAKGGKPQRKAEGKGSQPLLTQPNRWDRRRAAATVSWYCARCGLDHTNPRLAACRGCSALRGAPWKNGDSQHTRQKLESYPWNSKKGGNSEYPPLKHPEDDGTTGAPKVPKLLRHLELLLPKPPTEPTQNGSDEANDAAMPDIETASPEEHIASADVARLESLRAKLADLGYRAEADKVAADIRKAQAAARSAAGEAASLKRVFDAAHRHVADCRKAVNTRAEHIKRIEESLAKEKLAMTTDQADLVKAEALLDVAATGYHEHCCPDARPKPTATVPSPIIPDRQTLMAKLNAKVGTCPVDANTMQESYTVAQQEAQTRGDTLTMTQHCWNVMAMHMTTAVTNVLGEAMAGFAASAGVPAAPTPQPVKAPSKDLPSTHQDPTGGAAAVAAAAAAEAVRAAGTPMGPEVADSQLTEPGDPAIERSRAADPSQGRRSSRSPRRSQLP